MKNHSNTNTSLLPYNPNRTLNASPAPPLRHTSHYYKCTNVEKTTLTPLPEFEETYRKRSLEGFRLSLQTRQLKVLEQESSKIDISNNAMNPNYYIYEYKKTDACKGASESRK